MREGRHKLVRRGDPDTSRDAANTVDVRGLQWVVTSYIYVHGPSTGLEIVEGTGRHYSSITARFKELYESGIIYDTGKRRVRVGGKPQRVFDLRPWIRQEMDEGS